MKPGNYPLRSSLSRAAARSLLAARNAGGEELCFQVVSILDGKPGNLEALANGPRLPKRMAQYEAK